MKDALINLINDPAGWNGLMYESVVNRPALLSSK